MQPNSHSAAAAGKSVNLLARAVNKLVESYIRFLPHDEHNACDVIQPIDCPLSENLPAMNRFNR
jgi:hypothetical protein